MKRIAILGAGLVTEPLARYLMDECAYDVVMATRTPSKAEKIIGSRKNGTAVAWVAEQHDELDSAGPRSGLGGQHDPTQHAHSCRRGVSAPPQAPGNHLVHQPRDAILGREGQGRAVSCC